MNSLVKMFKFIKDIWNNNEAEPFDGNSSDLKNLEPGKYTNIHDLVVHKMVLCKYYNQYDHHYINGGCTARLRLPAGGTFVVPEKNNGKFRADKAIVEKITPIQDCIIAKSEHDSTFLYSKGKLVKPTLSFDDNISERCTSGIHFFATKEEAENY